MRGKGLAFTSPPSLPVPEPAKEGPLTYSPHPVTPPSEQVCWQLLPIILQAEKVKILGKKLAQGRMN